MSDPRESGGALLLLAAAVAFGVCYVAVAEHSACTATAYRLERAQRRHAELERRRAQVAGRLVALRNPRRVRERAAELGLTVGLAHDWRPEEFATGEQP